MEIKTSWLFTVPSGIVKFVSAVASFHLSRDRGVSCDSSVNEKIVATLCWDVRSSRKVELRILDTERLNVISNKKIEYLFPEYLDGVRWLVTTEGRFDMVLNMKDMVDKVASAELIKRKIVPDSANAISLLYSKKTSDRPDLVTLRKQIEEKIEKMNEKGILHVLPLHEFNGGTRMKMIKPLKSGKKILVPKLDQLIKEYPSATDPVSGKDVSWKTAKSAYSSEIMFGEQSSKPHVCCSSSCTEIAAEIKGLLFHDVYLTMKKFIFLNEGQNDNEFINTELQAFASESRFMYQKYCKKYPSMQHELFCYVQDLYEEVGVGEGKKLTIEKIEEIVAKMLGHPNTDTQLLVDNVNPLEFFNFVSSELYKTNYAFSHINFINLKVQCTYGFLIKLGGKLKNKWQDRYFILDRVLGLLVYYKKPPSRSFEVPAGMIHVTDLQDVERLEIAVSPKIFCLNLQPKDKMKKMHP